MSIATQSPEAKGVADDRASSSVDASVMCVSIEVSYAASCVLRRLLESKQGALDLNA